MHSDSSSHISASLFVILIAFISQPVLAQERLDDIPGWQDTRWGMSFDELVELYGSQLTLKLGETGGSVAKLEHYEVFGQDFVVSFLWRDNGTALSAVHLRSIVKTMRRSVAQLFEGSLITKYGPPEILENEEDNGLTRSGDLYKDSRKITLRWVLPSTILVYEYFSTKLIVPNADPVLFDSINIKYQENQAGRL